MSGLGVSDPNGSIERLVVNSRGFAQQLVAATDAETVWAMGMELFHIGMTAEEPALELSEPLWLIWGALTDAVDQSDSDTSAAVETMTRAAREWLAIGGGVADRLEYCDRWQYDECGDDRPRDQ
jgi:hypothetical protein